jgi:hypothetical protein
LEHHRRLLHGLFSVGEVGRRWGLWAFWRLIYYLMGLVGRRENCRIEIGFRLFRKQDRQELRRGGLLYCIGGSLVTADTTMT